MQDLGANMEYNTIMIIILLWSVYNHLKLGNIDLLLPLNEHFMYTEGVDPPCTTAFFESSAKSNSGSRTGLLDATHWTFKHCKYFAHFWQDFQMYPKIYQQKDCELLSCLFVYLL